MKSFALFFICLFHISATLIAQNEGSVTGILYDSTQITAVEFASVAVFDTRDSTVVNFGLTDNQGGFELTKLPFEAPLRLLVSHVIYGERTYDFRVSAAAPVHGFDTLFLAAGQELGEVVVTWERPPIVVRNDTLEFNAESFKTKPGSMVEDLLRKLPGVEVDRNGNITANGRPVSKITLDGSDFFGSDPVTVMRNLPSAVIEKVQISDEKDVFGEVTSNNVVINLTVKEGSKKGHFGKVFGGYGTDNRYEGGLLWNFFRDTMQLSLIGYANNLSQAGFSMTDLVNLGGFNRSNYGYIIRDGEVGMAGVSFGGGRGITRSMGGGFNYNYDVPEKLKINLSYFYGNNNSLYESRINRETFLPDSNLITNREVAGNPIAISHSIQGNLRWDIDSVTFIDFDPEVDFRDGNENYVSNTFHTYSGSTDSSFLNNTFDQLEDALSTNFRLSLSRYLKDRYSLQVRSNFRYQKSTANSENLIEQGLFHDPLSWGSVIQLREDVRFNTSTDNSFEWEKMLPKDWEIGVGAEYDYEERESDITTVQLDSLGGNNEVVLPEYSTVFGQQSTDISVVPSVSKKFGSWSVQFEPEFTRTLLETEERLLDSSITHQYYYINPSIRVRRSGAGKFFMIRYNYGLNMPEPYELLGAASNENPNYIVTGNPELEGYFSHSVYGYFANRSSKAITYHVNLSFSLNEGHIAENVSYSPEGVQVTTFENINENTKYLWLYSGLSKDFDLGNEWQLRPSFGFTGYWRSEYRFIEQELFAADGFQARPRLAFTILKGDKLDTKLSYGPNFNFSRVEELSPDYTQSVRHSVQFDVWYAFLENWWFESKFNLVSQPFYGSGFTLDDSYQLWNLSLTRTFMENKLQARLSVYDVLLQNRNIERIVDANFVENRYENAVTRYAMLSLVYNLHQFKTTGRSKRGFEFW